LPLLKRGLLKPETIVIDAKSGTSGAGRKASEELLFTEVDGECLPYRVGHHQHLPEICQYVSELADVTIDPLFTTHLLSLRRGILSGIYARAAEGVTELDLSAAYAEDYSSYGLVEWGSLRERTSRAAAFNLSLKRVVGTALTRLQFQLEGDRVYLFSLIDNLIKGAAGQAIENFNRLQNLSLDTGLKELEGIL
jgi:N-acetyl-gamma-glutamyl-phosphate reductase